MPRQKVCSMELWVPPEQAETWVTLVEVKGVVARPQRLKFELFKERASEKAHKTKTV